MTVSLRLDEAGEFNIEIMIFIYNGFQLLETNIFNNKCQWNTP